MWFRMVRDVAFLVGGLGIAAHEVLFVPDPRLPLLGLAAGLLGLPGFLVADRNLLGSTPPPDDEPPVPPPASHRKHT